MASRACSQCGFVTLSQVASACPHCGTSAGRRPVVPAGAVPSALPARLGFLALVALMLGLGYSSSQGDRAARARTAAPPIARPSLPAAPAMPATPVPRYPTGPVPPPPKTAMAAREALRSRDPRVRGAGADRLGRIGDRSATPLLLQSARDPDAGVRQESIAALASLYRAGNDDRPSADPQRSAVARALVAALDDSVGNVRVGAALALAEMREPRAVEPLIALLKNDDARWHAAHGLAEIGGPRAEVVLLDALRRKDYAIMAGAHRFYLRRHAPEMEPALLELLQKNGDLAVAQGFIVEGSPRLAEAARTWAGTQGFTLVKTPQGYTWQSGQ